MRLPVAAFVPNRSQRRAWRQHQDLIVNITKPFFSAEHYGLYNRYQSAKHTGGGMDHDDASQYVEFLVKSQVETMMIEFRSPTTSGGPGQLQMVSIVDKLDEGLSAVYTFYDPAEGNNLGTYNVLWQIQHAMALKLRYLYLGYWIEQSPKMAYKARFKPVEVLQGGHWHALSTPS